MNIGDRMKANYENRARHYLTRRMPVIVRVDGKAFHTYTRSLERPFDNGFVDAMIRAAEYVAGEMQGFKVGYVQSDEASFLLTDYDGLATEAWFDYNQSKIESVAASTMTMFFNECMGRTPACACFDARAFNIPREEAANYFLWRALDWQRNSVAMYCGSFYSAKQMHGQGRADQHEMLHAKDKNWATDLPPVLRNGTFLIRRFEGFEGAIDQRFDVLPQFNTINEIVEPLVNRDAQSLAASA